MKLAHLQQQILEMRENKDPEWGTGTFHKHIVMLHSHISGAAAACDNGQMGKCSAELAALVIRLVDFPSMFPDWGDIWGSQRLDDFSNEKISGDYWDHLYKLHQLASGLVGGRSDIILLYKMLQIARATAQLKGIDLPRAIKEQMDQYWQTKVQIN
jgi:hypothetical protein